MNNKNVIRSAIIKLAIESGLKPIIDSWVVEKEYVGDREYSIDYILKFECGIILLGNKYSKMEVGFEIIIAKKEHYNKAKTFLSKMIKYGYETKLAYNNIYDEKVNLYNLIKRLNFLEDVEAIRLFMLSNIFKGGNK